MLGSSETIRKESVLSAAPSVLLSFKDEISHSFVDMINQTLM
jgi:hypothetical protein